MGARRPPYPYRCEGPLGLLRLHLHAVEDATPVAGWWWPWSHELAREGPHLVNAWPLSRGRIDRIVYAARDWEAEEPELFTAHGRVKAGWFPPEHPGGVVLLRVAGSATVQLRVEWPDDALERERAAEIPLS